MPKKILLVDDSALMRRVLCDIIDTDIRFQVADRAKDGLEAFDLLSRNSYDAVVLDVNMPRMNGLQLLQELRKYKIPARVMMASTDTKEGARTTLDALELGALDFVHKPDSAVDCRGENFRREFLRTLNVVANSKLPVFGQLWSVGRRSSNTRPPSPQPATVTLVFPISASKTIVPACLFQSPEFRAEFANAPSVYLVFFIAATVPPEMGLNPLQTA